MEANLQSNTIRELSRRWSGNCRVNCRCVGRSQAAFSLLETIVATVLTSITLVTSLNSLAFVLKASSQQAHANRAASLAQFLLSEIAAQPFEDTVNATGSIGRESDELLAARPQWDDCDDYHGWSTPTITDRQGNTLAAAAGWAVNATVSYATVSDPAINSGVATKLKKIALTLTDPTGHLFTYSSLRCDKGTLLEPQSLAASILSHVEVSAQAADKSIVIGTRVHNQQELN